MIAGANGVLGGSDAAADCLTAARAPHPCRRPGF
jgi:hypothetical protein